MKNKISIVGAGLVGSLLALLLKQKGFSVEIFEKRSDPRKAEVAEGRSINLALSDRGIKPLKMAGIFEKIQPYLIPMNGRMMHDEENNLTSQPYGKEGQFINSVSRAKLNEILIEEAEKEGVQVFFDHRCETIDFEANTIVFENGKSSTSDLIIGADGAFSSIRKKLQFTDRFNYSQHYIEHGYKELSIDPIDGNFALEPNFLHIWPRGNFMLIALPNSDKSFTCTLFFPFEGKPSFDSLKDKEDVKNFFQSYFPDAYELIPNIVEQFESNPTSSLITITCDPWDKNRTLIIGDSAHAIVPFYGQGMNSGFEDVSLFIEMSEELDFDWDVILPKYSSFRKKDADAISELAFYNFVEMRDHVGDENFLRKKELERQIQEAYPNEWIPLYSMVTFSDMRYSEALRLGKIQRQVMSEFLSQDPENVDFKKVIDRFNALKIA